MDTALLVGIIAGGAVLLSLIGAVVACKMKKKDKDEAKPRSLPAAAEQPRAVPDPPPSNRTPDSDLQFVGHVPDPRAEETEPEWVREDFRSQDREHFVGDLATLPIQFPAGVAAPDTDDPDGQGYIDPEKTPGSLQSHPVLQWLPPGEGWTETGLSMKEAYCQTLEARPDLATGWGTDPEGRALDLPFKYDRGDPPPADFHQRLRQFPDGVKGGPSPGVLPPAHPAWRKRYIGDLPGVGSIASASMADGELLCPLLGGVPGSGTAVFKRATAVRAPPQAPSEERVTRPLLQRASLQSALQSHPISHAPRPWGFDSATGIPVLYGPDPLETLTPLPGYARGLQQLSKDSREFAPRPWRRPNQLLPDHDARRTWGRTPFAVPRAGDAGHAPVITPQRPPPPPRDAPGVTFAPSDDDSYTYVEVTDEGDPGPG